MFTNRLIEVLILWLNKIFVNQFLAFIYIEIYIYCSLFELVGKVCLGGRRSWRAGADCKSVGKRLWGFESLAAHSLVKLFSLTTY